MWIVWNSLAPPHRLTVNGIVGHLQCPFYLDIVALGVRPLIPISGLRIYMEISLLQVVTSVNIS